MNLCVPASKSSNEDFKKMQYICNTIPPPTYTVDGSEILQPVQGW